LAWDLGDARREYDITNEVSNRAGGQAKGKGQGKGKGGRAPGAHGGIQVTRENLSELEKKRFAEGKKRAKMVGQTAGNWAVRARTIRTSPIPAAVYGQGTHCLALTNPLLEEMRKAITSSLWLARTTLANPNLVLSLIESPHSTHPLSAAIYTGLLNMERVLRNPAKRTQLASTLSTPKRRRPEGPTARLLQVQGIPELTQVVTRLIRRPFNVDECNQWKHAIREALRERLYKIVLTDRPDFDGIQRGLDRKSTLFFLEKLEKKASLETKHWDSVSLDTLINQNKETAQRLRGKKDYTRAATQAYEFRKMLAGGLWSDDRAFRKDKNSGLLNGNCQYCELNELGTVEHWLWACPAWEEERAPACATMEAANKTLVNMPSCYRYAGINNADTQFTLPQMNTIHGSLLQVVLAQLRTKAQRAGSDDNDQPPDAPKSPDDHVPKPQIQRTSYTRRAEYNYGMTQFDEDHGHDLVKVDDRPGYITCTKCKRTLPISKLRDYYMGKCQGMPILDKRKTLAEARANNELQTVRQQHEIEATYRLTVERFRQEWLTDVFNGHKLEWTPPDNDAPRTSGEIVGLLKCTLCKEERNAQRPLKGVVNNRQFFQRHYCCNALKTGDPSIDTAEGRKEAYERKQKEKKDAIANRCDYDWVLANLEPLPKTESQEEREARARRLATRYTKSRESELKATENKKQRKLAADAKAKAKTKAKAAAK